MSYIHMSRRSGTRIFRCGYCSHHMRLGARKCGACYQPTTILNRSWFLVVLTLIFGIALFALTLMTFAAGA